jgi:iron complex outermembrane receptor protein
MFRRTKLCTGLLLAFGGTAAMLATDFAVAQEAQRVEITGSMIRRTESETALPVTVLKMDELQKAGVTNAEQAIKFITQQQGGTVTSSSVSGTNGAAAYADLRSLGAQRTLVLLNGKRVAPNPFATVATDLNTLPMAAIERIETLSDGASSIYGTDAVAGVINFITRRDYQGAAVGAQAQITEHGGANVYTADILSGWGDLDKQGFNVMAGLNLRKQDHMFGTERDFMKSSYIPDHGFNGTSPTTFPANYSQAGTVANANPTSPDCAPPTSISVPEANGTRIRCFADTQAFTHVVPEQDQWSLFLRGSLALGKDHTASLEYFHSYNKVFQQIAPSPESGLTMFPTSPFYPGNGITPDNPALNHTLPISIAWRTTVLGPRQSEQENHTQRVVGSLEGVVAGWDYQANALFSNAKVENNYIGGWPMTLPLRNGVSGCVLVSGACTGPLVVNGQQVFLNPFGDQTAAGLDYIRANQVLGQVQDGEARLGSLNGTLGTTFGSLPGGPMSVAFGGELRKDEMVYHTDVAKVSQAASSGLAGAGALREGDRDVEALSAEIVLPVLKNLELSAAIRYDHYSDFGSTTNPKVSLRYTPVKELLLRGSYNTGFAAPSLYQLNLPNSTTFTSTRYNDPVLCPNGVPAPGAVPSRDCGIQFQQMQGGNADLTAEKSKAWTVGFLVQPTQQLSFGVDYWDYYIKDSISTIGEQAIFADPAKYANLYVRCSQAPADRRNLLGACQNPGSVDPLAYVINTFLNLGDVKTNGVDLQINYNTGATPYGSFTAGLRGSYVNKYEFQIEPGGAWFNPVGNYNAQFGGPVIRYQQIITIGWETGPWSTLLTHRLVNGYLDQNSPASVAPAFRNHKVADYTTVDLAVSYRGIKGLTLGAGILNVLDKDPPFSNQSARFQARGYDDRFASPLGRTYQLSARYEF